MKKILLFVALILPVFCCSCKGGEVIPVLRNISFCADVSFYNEFYSLDTRIGKDGSMEIKVITPEDLNGLKLTYTGNDVTAEYMGIVYTPKTESMPLCGVSQMLYDVIRNVDSTVETASSDDGNCMIESSIGDYTYIFTFSPAGLPLNLEISKQDMKVEFKNVTVM